MLYEYKIVNVEMIRNVDGFSSSYFERKTHNLSSNLDLGINGIFLLRVRVPLNDISVSSSILKACCSG